jgi:hypothetical protein
MTIINSELQQLIDFPHETLNVEVKNWLDLSNKAGMTTLAKAAIALANHGGGFILLGFTELDDGTFEGAVPKPATLEAYSQDAIARIVSSYAEPAFQVQVVHIKRPATDAFHPVVIIPGGHRMPIQAKKGSPNQKTLIVGHVYIRRPTPESAEPATAIEWRELFDRCVRAGRDDLLNAIRGILDGHSSTKSEPPLSALQELFNWRDQGLKYWRRTQTAANAAAPEMLGSYCVAYKVEGSFPEPSFPELLEKVNKATVRHTGWSPWWVPTRQGIRPAVRDGAIERFLFGALASVSCRQQPSLDCWQRNRPN